MKKRGRKPTTGRYETREELEARVTELYYHTPAKPSQIARMCRVSEPVVHKILNARRPA